MRSLWCAAILAAGLAQGQNRQTGQGVNFYSREKEVALGDHLAGEFRKNTTPLDNPDVSDYVNRIGAQLAAQLPGGWTYRFEIVREDTGGPTHEPTALPGGWIFVPANLIEAARDETEFAGMLAHAMAHVAARHGTRAATKNELMQIAAMNAGPPGSTVPAGMLAFQRANEREADYIAVQAMPAAGYDPAGLAAYIQRLQPEQSPLRGVFDSLPARAERVAAIRAQITKAPAHEYQASDEFARVQAMVRGR